MSRAGVEPLLMIPGPVALALPVREALAEQVYAHTSDHCARDLLAIQESLLRIAGVTSGEAFAISGSGTVALELAALNLCSHGDKVLCVSNGYFGDRFAEIARRTGAEVEVLATAAWGDSVSLDDLVAKVARGNFSAVCLTHVDTSTSVALPLRDFASAIRSASDALVLVDGVCATGGMAEEMDRWGIDALATCCQKALAAPPGMALLVLSERAARRLDRPAIVPSLYLDLRQWRRIMADPRVYFSTHPVNLVRAVRVALDLVQAEGLEVRLQRHSRMATKLRSGMAELGFRSLPAAGLEASTVSALAYPEGTDDRAFREAMAQEGVIVAGCIGEWAGRALRIGHMGNTGEPEIERTLAAAATALSRN